jgi:hypothetical protein
MSSNTSAPIDLSQALDFTGVTTEFPLLDDGIYDALIEGGEIRVGQESGQPYISMTFALQGGAKGKLWNNFPLQPNSLWRLKKAAVAAGVPASKLEGQITIEDLLAELVNAQVQVRVVTENYTTKAGEPASRNAIKDILPAGSQPTGGAEGGSGKKKKGF